ncbi:Phosphoglycerate mutase-like protein AT74H [Hibiscus syriacus]|uniref:Phosphoglycerate mutase-like protein AT74H n=1 Tax=Hibiscus syriacus TaxID=106335 RepID=A0A6A2XZD5_HIBSY|nr:Phosphoglycerate mutase-like protein AT74H [Hibiscus syriacus]
MQNNNHSSHQSAKKKVLPKRIIIVRHGESEGNLDTSAYSKTPDYKISLTEEGRAQARLAGSHLRDLISGNGSRPDWRVYFYVSPYERTRSTLREIGKSFSKKRVIGVREECRIREQDFGNFQVEERMKVIKETREKVREHLFNCFLDHVMSIDFFDICVFFESPRREMLIEDKEISSDFLESLWRDIDLNRLHKDPCRDLNLMIISHGLASRVFLMKWFKWTVEQFEFLNNPENCECRVMELGQGGEYSLAMNHTDEEMLEWGLSPDMIQDQKWRITGKKTDWNDHCTWYLRSFFDELDSEDDVESN